MCLALTAATLDPRGTLQCTIVCPCICVPVDIMCEDSCVGSYYKPVVQELTGCASIGLSQPLDPCEW